MAAIVKYDLSLSRFAGRRAAFYQYHIFHLAEAGRGF